MAATGWVVVLASSRTLATISFVAASFTAIAAYVLQFLEKLHQLGQSTRVKLAVQLIARHMGLVVMVRSKELGHSRFDSGSLQVATFLKIYLTLLFNNQTLIISL